MKPVSLVAPLLILSASACSVLDPGRPRDQLERAKERWAQAKLTSYEYVVQRGCFCRDVDPVRIVVANGQVVARVDTVTGQPVSSSQASFFPDVPGLFALIEDAYDRADAINVSFDQTYGFPTSAVIDYVKNAADDELSLTAAHLRPVSVP